MHHSSRNKFCGVSILLHKFLSFQILATFLNPSGRYLMMKGTLDNTPPHPGQCLLSKQGPSEFYVPYHEAPDFSQGLLIKGGDLNTPFEPLIDTSNGHTILPFWALKSMKKKVRDLELVVSWRFAHPKDRDYSYFSPVHNCYSSWLDLIFIFQADLRKVHKLEICHITISDHARYPKARPSPKRVQDLALDSKPRPAVRCGHGREDQSVLKGVLWKKHNARDVPYAYLIIS